jgi:hypothetical protein
MIKNRDKERILSMRDPIPEQPNILSVNEMSDQELETLREQCSKELGRRGMSGPKNIPTQSLEESPERRAQKKIQQSGLKRLKKVGRSGVVRASSAESSGIWEKRAYTQSIYSK